MNQVNAFDNAVVNVDKLIVPNAGHTAHKENKQLVFNAVVKFVENILSEDFKTKQLCK